MTSFVDLAKDGKSFGDIKKLVDDVYGDKALKKTQIYKILKQVNMGKNRRGFTKQKTKITTDLKRYCDEKTKGQKCIQSIDHKFLVSPGLIFDSFYQCC
jgi:hypothetical protein